MVPPGCPGAGLGGGMVPPGCPGPWMVRPRPSLPMSRLAWHKCGGRHLVAVCWLFVVPNEVGKGVLKSYESFISSNYDVNKVMVVCAMVRSNCQTH